MPVTDAGVAAHLWPPGRQLPALRNLSPAEREVVLLLAYVGSRFVLEVVLGRSA